MLAVTHTVTSAAIGAHVQQAPVAFALAFLFHLFTDTLLHWNIYTDRHRWPYAWIALDVVGGVLVTAWLLSDRFWQPSVLASLLGGNLPDFWHGGRELWRKLRRTPRHVGSRGPFLRFHAGLQHETVNPWKGLPWQVAVGVASLWLIRTT